MKEERKKSEQVKRQQREYVGRTWSSLLSSAPVVINKNTKILKY